MIDKKQNGSIALLTTLIIFTIILSVGLGVSLRTATSPEITFDQQKSHKALTVASSCIDFVLLSILNDVTYYGNHIQNFETGSCFIEPILSPTNTSRIIRVSGAVDGFTRRVYVEISSVLPPIIISAWQEVDSF